jgi:hypothetical protein
MSTLRLLVLSVLFSACAASVAAQSFTLRVTPPQEKSQPQRTPNVASFQLAPIAPQSGLAGRSVTVVPGVPSGLPRTLTIAGPRNDSNAVCYDIRSYNFAAGDSGSDAMRPTGSSTCQPSSQLKLKSTATPHVKLVR